MDFEPRRPGEPKRRLTARGMGAAACVAIGSIGLMLVAVIVLVQHKGPRPASALFVVVLLAGIVNHVRSRGDAGGTDDG